MKLHDAVATKRAFPKDRLAEGQVGPPRRTFGEPSSHD